MPGESLLAEILDRARGHSCLRCPSITDAYQLKLHKAQQTVDILLARERRLAREAALARVGPNNADLLLEDLVAKLI